MEALLHDRLAQPVLLSELAEACGLSRSYLIQNFREATGGTPVRYLTRLRMESARRLLETTSLPVVNAGPNIDHFAAVEC